jgi:hypothetical protein
MLPNGRVQLLAKKLQIEGLGACLSPRYVHCESRITRDSVQVPTKNTRHREKEQDGAFSRRGTMKRLGPVDFTSRRLSG